MNEEAPQPALTPKAEAAKAERLAREAAALRENLRRRKAQSRARQDHDVQGPQQGGPRDADGAT
jgi:hypothetical protein